MSKKNINILRDPIVHFFVLALVLLAGHACWQSMFSHDISLEQEALDAMLLAERKETKKALSFADSKALVKHHIETEILFLEAIERGMLDEPVVKEFLAQQLRSELAPVLPKLSEQKLKALYNQDSDSHQYPAKISFEHVSFAHNEKRIPARLVEQLNSGADPLLFDNRMAMASPIPLSFKPQIDRLLGQETSTKVFELAAGVWHGPISSEKGIHYIRVLNKVEAEHIPFETLKPTLESNWQDQQKQLAVAQAVAELASKYRISLPDDYKDLIP